MTDERAPVAVTVRANGEPQTGLAEPRTSLADFLRDALHLRGTRIGCEHGVCGACTVLVDSEPVRGCLMLAVQAQDREVTTIEGLTGTGDGLTALQEAFREGHGLQCGFCTSGMLLCAHALLSRDPDPDEPTIRDELHGNLCRCTGYQQIVESVRLASARLAADGER